MITNDAKSSREIKSRIAMLKAAFNEKETFSKRKWTSILGRNW